MEFKLVKPTTYDDLDSFNSDGSEKYPGGWRTLVDWAKDQGEDLITFRDSTPLTNYPKIQGILQEFGKQSDVITGMYGWNPRCSWIIVGKIDASNDAGRPVGMIYGQYGWDGSWEGWVEPYDSPLLLVRPL